MKVMILKHIWKQFTASLVPHSDLLAAEANKNTALANVGAVLYFHTALAMLFCKICWVVLSVASFVAEIH